MKPARLSYARQCNDDTYLCATRFNSCDSVDLQCYVCSSPLCHERPNNGDRAYFRHIGDAPQCTDQAVISIVAREIIVERMTSIRYLFECEACHHTKTLFVPGENDVARIDYEWTGHIPDIVYTDMEETPQFMIEIGSTSPKIAAFKANPKIHWAIVSPECVIAAFEANRCDLLVEHSDTTLCSHCMEQASVMTENQKRIEEEIRRSCASKPKQRMPTKKQPPVVVENALKRKQTEIKQSVARYEEKQNRVFTQDDASVTRATQFNEYERMIAEARKRRKLAACNNT